MTRDAFVARYGGVYEHSPWIAEALWDSGGVPDGQDGLAGAMAARVEAAGEEAQLALLRAHPDLAGKLAVRGELTAASTSEQAGAGLDQCTPEEFDAFQRLNEAYKARFGFPFILAVKGYDRAGILNAFRHRVGNDRAAEFREALDQVHRIARLRLQALACGPMTATITPEPLTAEAFAPFGTVIETTGASSFPINGGTTTRFHALAKADTGPEGEAILSIFRASRWPQPVKIRMLERHPLGSQAFYPLSPQDWLIVVAAGERPAAQDLRLFRARGDQGAQYARGVWHHPLLILTEQQDFLVVDRSGPGENLEEIAVTQPVTIVLP
jgi:ureidoglycolate lyase